MSVFCNNIYEYRDNIIVNEAYVGKTPILEAIEKKIGELRKDIKFSDHLNRNKTLIEINRLFEKQFGMDIFALHIYNSMDYNGYTYSISNKFDVAEENESLSHFITGDNKNGYKYKPGNNLSVLVEISYGIMSSKEITDAEVLAIILHEIGHNFSNALYGKLYMLNRNDIIAYRAYFKQYIITSAILSIFTFGLTLPYTISLIKNYNMGFNSKENKKYKKDQKKKPNKFIGFINSIKGKFNDYQNYIGELQARSFGGKYIEQYMKNLEDEGINRNLYKNDSSRVDEVIADKFAGIYGYGVEQTSVLFKMDFAKSRAYNQIEATGTLAEKKKNQEYNKAFLKINDYDCHPYTVQRANEEIKLLKREYEKEDIDPRIKEVLISQIEMIEEIIAKNSKASKELSESDNARRLYNEVVNKEFPDAVTEELEGEIEDALDKFLNGEEAKVLEKKTVNELRNNYVSKLKFNKKFNPNFGKIFTRR